MEGKSSASMSLIRGKSCRFRNPQESPHPFKDLMISSNSQPRDAFSIQNRNAQKPNGPISFLDCRSKFENYRNGDSSYAVDGNNETERERNESPWQRVKWTDQMVKLMVTAVSYIGEDATSAPLMPKKGKWKAISKVMDERGFHVSPQQCEDKFNDLNKRYKKLNDTLGRGTSCEVVENPSLLDSMDISDKKKDSVIKILNSKQLFYEEMCSYHNGNRLHIPHDHAIQRSLLLALKNSGDLNILEAKSNGLDDEEQNCAIDAKRKKPRDDEEYYNSGYLSNFGSGFKGNKWFMSRSLRLEERKLQIEGEKMELEKERIRWLRLSEAEDRELEKMKLKNKYLKLDNERLALEIRRWMAVRSEFSVQKG